MRTTLFVSPHFDDAVLSCAGTMIARRRAGERVIVCSVFTRSSSHTRRREDLASLARVDAEPIVLGFDDAPVRERVAPSFTSLVLDGAVRPALARQVSSALRRVIATARPDELWLPLGVGGHVDHRTVFDAGLGLRSAARVRFYAERPYDFVPLFRALRRRELAGGPPRRATAATLAAQIAAGGCDALVEPSERAHVLEALVRRLSRPEVGARRVSFHALAHPKTTLAPALACIAEHRSQIAWLFGARPLASIWKTHAGTSAGWSEVEARLASRASNGPRSLQEPEEPPGSS